MVAVVSRGLFCPGRRAGQGLQSSMWRRVTCAVLVTSGTVWARKAAKQRSARSAPPTLPGRRMQPIRVR
jgi:hypothetical protein